MNTLGLVIFILIMIPLGIFALAIGAAAQLFYNLILLGLLILDEIKQRLEN